MVLASRACHVWNLTLFRGGKHHRRSIVHKEVALGSKTHSFRSPKYLLPVACHRKRLPALRQQKPWLAAKTHLGTQFGRPFSVAIYLLVWTGLLCSGLHQSCASPAHLVSHTSFGTASRYCDMSGWGCAAPDRRPHSSPMSWLYTLAQSSQLYPLRGRSDVI